LDEKVLRISMDAKATIKLGRLSRRGRSRVEVQALDHDFVKPEDKVYLFGFYLPDHDETHFFFLPDTRYLTADALVDCLERLWEQLCPRFPHVTTLLLNLDNGPECQSHRRQFIKRLVDFVDTTALIVDLAYYPPYHSKYNPIERVWGVLEQHWNGSLLDSVETVLQMARTMTYKKAHPVINVLKKSYLKGVSLTKKAMKALETRLERLDGLEKYFVNISPRSAEAG